MIDMMSLLWDTQRIKLIFTMLTRVSFQPCQTTSVTMTRYCVTHLGISTGQAAGLKTIISKQAVSTLCQMKFTTAVISHVGKLRDVYSMRFASFYNVFIFSLKHTFVAYGDV